LAAPSKNLERAGAYSVASRANIQDGDCHSSNSGNPKSTFLEDLPKWSPNDPREHRDREPEWASQSPVPHLPAGILAEALSPKVGKGTSHLSRLADSRQ
jgi:hypothetical protein